MFDYGLIEDDVKEKVALAEEAKAKAAEAKAAEEKAAAEAKAAKDRASPSKTREEEANAMIKAKVSFYYRTQRWAHEFKVRKGSKIIDLKRTIASGDPAEACWFDLTVDGKKVGNNDEVIADTRFTFSYLGPPADWNYNEAEQRQANITSMKSAEEAASVSKDVAEKAATEKAAAEAAAAEKASAEKAAADKAAAEKAAAEKEAAEKVAAEKEAAEKAAAEKEKEAVERAAAEKAAAEKEAADKAAAAKTAAEQEAAAAKEAAEKAAAEKAAAEAVVSEPAAAAKDLTINVWIDRDLDFKSTVVVKSGSTIGDVKEALAAGDPTGQTLVKDISLAEPWDCAGIPDSTVLTDRLLELDLV